MSSSRSRRALAASVAALAMAGPGCVRNPVSGWPEVTFMSTEREIELGRQASEQVRSEMGLVEAERLNAYVKAIGARIAKHSPRTDVEYHFAVVDMQEPNAFALPGGWIYVSRGLIAIANSEDELAGVIGHEIGHVAARHAAQRQTRATGLGILALPSMVLGAALGSSGEILGSPFLLLGSGMLASYSRAQESEADEVGQTMAAEAGYDPAALTRFLGTLEAATSLEAGESRGTSFFDTHPSTPERVAETERFASELAWERIGAIAPTRQRFLDEIVGLLIGPNPAGGIFDGASFLHPYLGFSMRFPPKWSGMNTPRAVAALSPERDAHIRLEMAGEGSDVREAVTADLQALGQEVSLDVVESEPIEVGGLPAYRAQVLAGGRSQAVPLEITWISFGGSIYRLTGAARREVFPARQREMRAAAQSFRPLTAADRRSIHEQRLRVSAARRGETLAALSSRASNAWSVDETAVANSLPVGKSLEAGALVKVSVRQPYVPPGGSRK